jgi:Dolichyl-phosphate-mannose-protein mannosyltransferase
MGAMERLVAALAGGEAAAGVLALGAVVTIVVGALRTRSAFLVRLPGAVFVLLGALYFLPIPGAARPWVVGGAGLALVVQAALDYRARPDPTAVARGSSRGSLVYLGAAVVVAAVLVLDDLGGYAGTLQRWEATVVYGFGMAADAGTSVARYTLDRLEWGSNILSLGYQSLFYGAPTYGLFQVLGYSAWTLRIAAVVAMLASIVAMYALGRRFFGPLVGGAAAMLLALNECALFYGRYGSSPAATVFCVLLAVFATLLFLDCDRPAWWMSLACAATLFVATLHYAPGRLVVLILLGFIPMMVVLQWRRLSWQRVVGLVVLVVGAVGVWVAQGPQGQAALFSGQGEQFFFMTKFPDYVARLCPSCQELLPDQTAYQMALLQRWFGITVPEYLSLIGPGIQTGRLRDWAAPVFPQLYYGPLAVFVLWGVVHSLRRWTAPPHALLLVWVAGATVPLLLTNRVDSHRMMLFVIPLTLWGALGVWEAARLMRDATVPTVAQHLLAAALAVTVVAHDVQLLWGPTPRRSPASRVLSEEIANVPGRVAVGGMIDTPNDTLRDFGFVQLELLERGRLDPTRKGVVVPSRILMQLQEGGSAVGDETLDELAKIVDDGTLVLAPADVFRPAATALERRGARIVEVGDASLGVLRIEPRRPYPAPVE